MRYAVLIGDGMADEPRAELGGKTPLEAARTPHMDAIAAEGELGLVATIPKGMSPGSDVANLCLMGYDPRESYTGRAAIEAAGMGVELGPGDTAFRMNLVSIRDGRMEDYSAGAIETEDARALVEDLRREIEDGAVRLYPGVSYRHLLVARGLPAGELRSTPPHDIAGEPVDAHLPRGAGSDFLRDLMLRARRVLRESPRNRERAARGKVPATDIWLWGQGAAMDLTKIPERYGISGAVITAVDLVRGIGRLAGLEVLRVEGATGYLDTNYEGKVGAAAGALASRDLVYLHVEAPDEASHEGSLEKKIRAIEDFDARVVGPIRRLRERFEDLRILVLPDHATLLSTKTHDPRPVPYALSGPGVAGGGPGAFSEAAASGAPVLRGPELFERLVFG